MKKQRGSADSLLVFGLVVLISLATAVLIWDSISTDKVASDHQFVLSGVSKQVKTTTFSNTDFTNQWWFDKFSAEKDGALASWEFTDGRIYNSLGGLVTITPVEGTPHDMIVTSRGFDESGCQDLATSGLIKAQSIGIGSSLTNIKAATSDHVSPDAVRKACSTDTAVTFNFVVGASR